MNHSDFISIYIDDDSSCHPNEELQTVIENQEDFDCFNEEIPQTEDVKQLFKKFFATRATKRSLTSNNVLNTGIQSVEDRDDVPVKQQ